MTRSRMSEDEVERLLRAAYEATPVRERPNEDHPLALADVRASRRAVARWAVPLAAAAAVVVISGALFATRAGSASSRDDSPAATATGQTDPASVAAAPTSRPEPPVPLEPPKGMSQPQLLQRLSTASGRIEDLARSKDPYFDIIAVDRNAHGKYVDGLTVYRAAQDPGNLSAAYASVVPHGMTISYAHALLSEAQQNHLSALVGAQAGHLKNLGVHVTTYGGEDFPGGHYRIGYDPAFSKPSPELLRQFEVFGPGTVVFYPQTLSLAQGSS
jgi:hypothetical protein